MHSSKSVDPRSVPLVQGACDPLYMKCRISTSPSNSSFYKEAPSFAIVSLRSSKRSIAESPWCNEHTMHRVALLLTLLVSCGPAPKIPGESPMKLSGSECQSHDECRSGLCLGGLTEKVCFDRRGSTCIRLSHETSLPISRPDFAISCPSKRPALFMCGNGSDIDILCSEMEIDGGSEGFRFACCPPGVEPCPLS